MPPCSTTLVTICWLPGPQALSQSTLLSTRSPFGATPVTMAIVFNIASFENMIALKIRREENCQKNKCKTRIVHGHLCGRCRRMSQKLCRAYHKGNPETKLVANNNDPVAVRNILEELVLRITYEYVFDYIDMETIVSAMWLVPSGNRCIGHTKRLFNLAAAIYRHHLEHEIDWLDIARALKKRNEVMF